MKTVDEARELAQTMVNLGKAVDRKTVAVKGIVSTVAVTSRSA